VSRFNNRLTRLALSVVLTSVVALGAALPAFAEGGDSTSLVVTGGNLGITTPAAGDFIGVSLDGTAQQTTASLAGFSVTDPRGTGSGWHVTAQATQFTGSSHNLAASSLTMSQPSVTPNGTTSPAPTVATGPYMIDVASAVQIASADTDQGMGQYDFGATTLTLTIPANTYADTYNSTVTISVVTAP
jgi:hypothetical protein